jgi:hypothetical protein
VTKAMVFYTLAFLSIAITIFIIWKINKKTEVSSNDLPENSIYYTPPPFRGRTTESRLKANRGNSFNSTHINSEYTGITGNVVTDILLLQTLTEDHTSHIHTDHTPDYSSHDSDDYGSSDSGSYDSDSSADSSGGSFD